MWEKLLSLKKKGDINERLRSLESETRLGFEADYDRVVFSNYFRSLQDKTQVIPLSKTSFVHTRLTHSMEVSVVGRSLGRLVGEEILKKYPSLVELGYKIQDFGAVVACAALAHDIGNPPFGHSGEKAIGEFFSHKEGQILKDLLSEKEFQDLCLFEGNANGFRILVNNNAGLKISYATLGTFIKYPKQSLPKKPSTKIWDKKYNIFQSEVAFFEELAQDLGLIYDKETQSYARHPLAFLVEAADDICYSIIDFEDGCNLGFISEETAIEYTLPIVLGKDFSAENKENFFKKYHSIVQKQDRISYLRALSIGKLIQEATRVFIENEEKILKGEFYFSLLDRSIYKEDLKKIIALSVEKIYQSKEVLSKEISGYEILQKILKKYFLAIMNFYNERAASYDELVLKTLPEIEFSSEKIKENSLYTTMLNLVCYIASLTDTQVMEFLKE